MKILKPKPPKVTGSSGFTSAFPIPTAAEHGRFMGRMKARKLDVKVPERHRELKSYQR